MQEIKFVQTQQTANDPIWAPIKGKKILQLNSCHGRTGVITDEKQPDPNKKKLPIQREQKTEKDIIST